MKTLEDINYFLPGVDRRVPSRRNELDATLKPHDHIIDLLDGGLKVRAKTQTAPVDVICPINKIMSYHCPRVFENSEDLDFEPERFSTRGGAVELPIHSP